MDALTYADDLALLAPSPAALRSLLYICEQFGAANMFNPDNSQCIKFSHSCTSGSCSFLFLASQFFVLSLLCT